MRPQLKPGLRRMWRDDGTLQIGLEPGRAIVLAGLGPAAAAFVDALDGTRDHAGALATARSLGVDEHTADQALALLASAGALADASGDARPLRDLDPDERDRLQPDLASLALRRSGRPGGDALTTLGRRRASVVAVHGAGRVGASVATVLAAAGVGHVVVIDPGVATPPDAAPAGISLLDTGVSRQAAAAAAMRRVAPATRADPPYRRSLPDLAILAPSGARDPELLHTLQRAGVPHLLALVRETTGVVGPLVLPGRSSCVRCHDLHRTDRDPAWPRLVAQLAAGRPRGPVACDVALATAVAAHAALQALALLDGEPAPSAVDGTLEIGLPDGRVRRRSWSPHPACGCRWAAGEGETG